MKKKFVGAIAALALVCAFALPVLAFADNPSAEAGAATNPSAQGGGDTTVVETSYGTKVSTVQVKIDKGDTAVTVLSGTETDDQGGVRHVYFSVETGSDVDVDLSFTEDKASNFVEGDYLLVRSFRIEAEGYQPGATVTVVYDAGMDNSGLTCRVFIEHDDGTTEKRDIKIGREGQVSFEMKNMSTITFAIMNKAEGNGSAASAPAIARDKSSTSPKTGGIL